MGQAVLSLLGPKNNNNNKASICLKLTCKQTKNSRILSSKFQIFKPPTADVID